MAISTGKFVAELPGKDVTEGVDWMGILDAFDPTTLDQKYVDECARRNPFVTCYRWETPPEPIEGRLESSKTYQNFARCDLESCVERIKSEGLTPTVYKLVRAALIKAIGEKGVSEYNRREYERFGEDGRRKQVEEYTRWEQECKKRWEQREREEAEYEAAIEAGDYGVYDGYYEQWCGASMHEKVVKIRKGMLGSNGKPLTQRDFAKYIGYPISKYAAAERIDRWARRGSKDESEVEFELLEKLIMICHANPYWLFDDEAEADYAEYNMAEEIVRMGDAPCVYALPDIILRWIEAGKPRATRWKDTGIWS